MNSEIKEGSRVKVATVRKVYRGFDIKTYMGTVKGWAANGNLQVVSDDDGKTKNVSADNVKVIRPPMTYQLFCQILSDNLEYEFTDNVSAEQREEWQQDWYTMFKENGYWTAFKNMTLADQVRGWMHEHFDECSFDTHSFQLKLPQP